MDIVPGIHLSRIRVAAIAVVLAVAGLLVSASQVAPARAASVHAAGGGDPKPTIVLEHGAWAGGSSWAGVIRRLHGDGYTVYAPRTEAKVDTNNPSRGPLLILDGELDHTVPWAVANASYQGQKRNPAVTEIVKIPAAGTP